MHRAAACVLCLLFNIFPALAARPAFNFDQMMKLTRIDDPQLSPDGKLVAFTAQTVDLASNTKPIQIYTVSSAGGAPVQVTTEGTMNMRPRWSPDSQRLFFVSNRVAPGVPSGVNQVWSSTVDGSDAHLVTNLPTGADGETVSPDGHLLLFTSDVYPACEKAGVQPGAEYDNACNLQSRKKEETSKMHARVYGDLLYRHWTEYKGQTRRHLLIETLDDQFKVHDLTPGYRDAPPFSLGGLDGYTFSPDSVQIAYVANLDRDPSTSTNSDLFLVDASGGAPRKLTTNPGADEGPVFSPDGRSLAFRTQFHPGFESDQWRLAIMNVASGVTHTIADQLDRWVLEYCWSSDSKRIFFTTADRGTVPLLMAPAAGGNVRTIAEGPSSIGNMQFSHDDRMMIYLEQSGVAPPEIKMATSRGGSSVQLTHLNDDLLTSVELRPLETIESDGADGSKIQSFLAKPPDFDPTRRYPVLFFIHGGPQGDWGQTWSYRWNPQVFAAAGYLVVMPNPHGSIGYGQNFTDSVSEDWGGKAYADIMAVADAVAALPYVDKDRMTAAGASYGGYMIDWILGHTNRFKALVSHAGVFDMRSEAGTTDELWFVKREFGGFPWDSALSYEKWSPILYANNFHTPTLVTQGEIDYRVPIGQSQELFTALQQHDVPSKLVLFPEEGHWILKPQNSQYWYAAVLDWINKYTRPPATLSTAANHD